MDSVTLANTDCGVPSSLSRWGTQAKTPLILAAVVALLTVSCSTKFVDSFPDRTLRSDIHSSNIRLELVRPPSASTPLVVFHSARETEHVDQVEYTSEYIRTPKPALTWGLLGASVISFFASMDMMNGAGSIKYAPATLLASVSLALSAGYLHYVQPGHRFKTHRSEAIRRKTSRPLDVDVSLVGGRWHQRLKTDTDCEAAFGLHVILDSIPARKNIVLEAHVVGRPEHACSVRIERGLLDSLAQKRARERRLKAAEERQLREWTADADIGLGMDFDAVKKALGTPVHEEPNQELRYFHSNNLFIVLLFGYSHVTGRWTLAGIYARNNRDDLQLVFGNIPVVPEYAGYPDATTGRFRRRNQRWYFERYWQGNPVWVEIAGWGVPGTR
jgi:hypothetical protein